MKKNIVIFSNTLLSGGAEKQAVELAKILSKTHKIYLVVFYGDQIEQKYIGKLIDCDLTIHLLRGNILTKLIEFYKILKHNKIQIIFSYLLTTNLIGGIVGKFAGVNYTIGGIRSSKLDKNKKYIQKFLHNIINNYTIFNNKAGLKKLCEMGFKKNKAILIYNHIDILPTVEQNNISEKINILSVGRFTEVKDYFTALEAMKLLTKEFKEFRYTIIGHGPLKNDIEAKIKELDLLNFVNLLESPNDVYDYYLNADIYISTSLFEGLSNTILEAMNAELPIIATNVGDNAELISINKNGYLIDIKSPIQLKKSLNFLISNYSKRIEMGKYSKKILMKSFAPEKFEAQYKSFIKTLYEK